MGFLGLEQREQRKLASPIAIEGKSASPHDGTSEKPATSSASSADHMEIDEPDKPVLTTRTQWIGTSQFAVEQNLEIQHKV
jgi:hypothetical protein